MGVVQEIYDTFLELSKNEEGFQPSSTASSKRNASRRTRGNGRCPHWNEGSVSILDGLRVSLNSSSGRLNIWIEDHLVRNATDVEIRLFFGALVATHKLQKLGVWSEHLPIDHDEDDDDGGSSQALPLLASSFPVHGISSVLGGAAKDLIDLQISGISLTGPCHDFQTFACSLGHLIHLKRLVLDFTVSSDPTTIGQCSRDDNNCSSSMKTTWIDQTMESLSKLPNLERLLICDFGSSHSSFKIGQLFASSSIRDLTLLQLDIRKEQMNSLSNALAENRVLKYLHLSCSSSLRMETAKPFFQSLSRNQCLEELTLRFQSYSAESCIDIILDSLRYNTSLRNVSIYGIQEDEYSPSLRKALENLWMYNYNLEHLFVEGMPRPLEVSTDFYLHTMNRVVGRNLLFRHGNFDRQVWIEGLNRASDDLDTLYLLLRPNPSILWCMS